MDNLSTKFYKILCVGRTLCKFHIGWNSPFDQKETSRKCLLFKRDLKRTYRQIPVDVTDVPLLGYAFEDQYYFDLFLSMGLRSAAQICQRVTNAIQYMCHILHIAI